MGRRSDNIDSVMDSLNEWEKKQRGELDSNTSSGTKKVLVGTVDQFFDKISVAAVKLTGDLRVGDVIEIGDDEDAVRQRVTSMQIDREDIDGASEGDDVGIKLKHNVSVGSSVYKITSE